MLGRRNPQRSLFSVQHLPHPVPADSFYGRMGAVSDELFPDDDMAMMYCADNGRPSIPPSLMNGVRLLQLYDDVSDEEAVDRTKYDLRWKVALDLPLDFPGFHPTSLTKYRGRAEEHDQECYAFDRLVAVGRRAGFIPDRVTLLVDSTNVGGAGAVQDTYTLLRKAMRKVLKAAGFSLPGKRRGLAPEVRTLLERYLDQDCKADIDWADPEQRLAQLQVLFADAQAVLDLAAEQGDDDQLSFASQLLTKIVGDDIVTDDQGQAQIRKGTAKDRIVSVTDPEMRHGRKSASKRFDGFKTSVATDQSSEMILDIRDVAASSHDGEQLMPTIKRVQANTGVVVERVIGDGAYGTGENRAACAADPNHVVDVVSPVREPGHPKISKSAFEIDLEARTATCPAGHTVTGQRRNVKSERPWLKFTFDRPTCEACALFEDCCEGKRTGRTVQTNPYEVELRAARLRQETEEFDRLYRLRPAVERKIGELVSHGLRNTRYIGESKRLFQRLSLGAALNLKRLFTLAEAKDVDLRAVFKQHNACQATRAAA